MNNNLNFSFHYLLSEIIKELNKCKFCTREYMVAHYYMRTAIIHFRIYICPYEILLKNVGNKFKFRIGNSELTNSHLFSGSFEFSNDDNLETHKNIIRKRIKDFCYCSQRKKEFMMFLCCLSKNNIYLPIEMKIMIWNNMF